MAKRTSPRGVGIVWLLGVVAIVLLGFKVAVVDRMETPFRYAKLREDRTLPGIGNPIAQPFADGLELIGFEQSTALMPADGVLRVDLHWTVRQQPSRRYQTVVHLVGPEGMRWSRFDSYRPTDYQDAPPTTTWVPGRHALDSHEVEPLPGTPPGTYYFVLTVFDRETLTPLSVLNEALQPAAPELILGQVDLITPRSPVSAADLEIQYRLDVTLGPLTLLGVSFDREHAAPGDSIAATTFWRVDQEPGEELALHLELLDVDDSPVAMYALSPTVAHHPVSTWQPDHIFRAQHVLDLAGGLESGEYGWLLSVPPIEETVNLPAVIRVDAPERVFSAPPVDAALGVRFAEVAILSGASFEPELSRIRPGDTVSVTLVWRAEIETGTSYRVFVHLLNPEGHLVAQSDGMPAGWTRPTTGWMPGEYVMDLHTLTIPADAFGGDYQMQAGLYSPDGRRLATVTGADAVDLVAFVLESAE